MNENIFSEIKDALWRVETGDGTLYDARLLRAVISTACLNVGRMDQAVELIKDDAEGITEASDYARMGYGGTA